MRLFILVMLGAATLFGTASTGGAQPQYAKALIGKWAGDIQQSSLRVSPDRTLIIESVADGEGTVPFKGRFGVTGQGLGRMEGTLEIAGGQLRFTTNAGAKVVLQLSGEKDLTGTIEFRGTGEGIQQRPMRLRKVE
ncbi:MAG TPA: hypothetical protein VML54_13485 [Candidatus Limnocylindrales bacterium]|nr:hypothetical protein [Candidatus Limnocylindrales bacterium]